MFRCYVLIAIIMVPLIALADIYKYVDGNGHITYSRTPVNEKSVKIDLSPNKEQLPIAEQLPTEEQLHQAKVEAKLKAREAERAEREFARWSKRIDEETYREKVKATAKFMDDVEALRKSKKQHAK